MSRLVRRDCGSSTTGRCASFAGTADDQSRWPALVEFLGSCSWPDGQERRPGTLLIFLDEGRLKACLSDRAQGLVLFTTGDSVTGLIDAVEASLCDPRADWRRARPAPGGRGAR